MPNILIVDDEARILLLLQSLLKANGYQVTTVKSGDEALKALNDTSFDLIVTDLRMAPMDGLELLKEVKSLYPLLPIVLLTAYASVESAIEALKCGAFDYIAKPFKVDELLNVVQRAVDSTKLNRAIGISDPNAPLRYQFENLIANSKTMQQVCEMIERVGPTSTTILLNGESGTGKEVIARTIHNASPRREQPLIAINCAALPENLVESELFGHVKGAFTGADSDKDGLFEAANGGTLFLDEVASLPLVLQGKLLRVLQEKEVRRVGGNQSVPVDTRVIAASNTNLEQMVTQGAFRADLYYRLAVITLDIPPLRERQDDILPLARHFIAAETTGRPAPILTPEAARVLLDYRWPGNVRELENAIKHAITFLEGDMILPEVLPPRIVSRATPQLDSEAPLVSNALPGAPTSLKGFLKAKEREYLEQILDASNGDKEKAAQALQVSLATLYRKLSDTGAETAK